MNAIETNRPAGGGQGNLGAELAAKKQNIDEYKDANNPTMTGPVAKNNTPSAKDKVNPAGKFGLHGAEQRINVDDMTKPLGSFEHGTDHVPHTGVYKLHKGEAVIPKDKNMRDMKDKMVSSLSDEEGKPKKEIKEMHIRKSANGKHIVKHIHHHPAHPDEEHVMNDMAMLHQHMDDHAGEPNEGEAAPAEGSAPTPMTAAPSPMPPAGGQ